MDKPKLSKHNQRELRKLILSVRANANRLDLFVAVCSDRALQARLIQEYETTLQAEGISTYQAWLDLKQPSLKATLTSLVERERSLQKESKAVVTVLGGADLLGIKLIEQDDKSEQDKLFFSLQWTRESLRDFTFPIIFWLSDAVTTRLSQQAPDFWSWRGGVFEFEDEIPDDSTSPVYPEPLPLLLDQRDEREPPSRPIADLEQEIDALHQQNPSSPLLTSLYNNLGRAHYHNNDYEAALVACNQAKTLAQTHKDRLQQAKALYGLGATLSQLRRFEQALNFLEQALTIAETIGDYSEQGKILRELGRAYRFLGQYEQAIAFHEKSLAIRRQFQDHRGEAYSLHDLGFIYYLKGQYKQAIELLQQALEMFRQVHDNSGESASLNVLGDVYHSLGNYKQAIVLHQQSLDISRRARNSWGEAVSLNSLGLAYTSLNKYDQAIAFYDRALEIDRQLNNRYAEGGSLCNLGNAYFGLGQNETALKYYQQALDILSQIDAIDFKAETLLSLATTYDRLVRTWEAKEHYETALELYKQMDLHNKVKLCEDQLKELGQRAVVMPTQAPAIPAQPRRSRLSKSQTYGLWGAGGVAIALLLWWWLVQ